MLSETDAADLQTQIGNQGFQISFDSGNQLYTFYPDMTDLPTVRTHIESVRQHIADMGFTDAAPLLQVAAWSTVTLSDSLATEVGSYSATSTNWADAYSLLGLDPPGDDPTPGDPLTMTALPDGYMLSVNFDGGTQTFPMNPRPVGSDRPLADVRAEIESVRARIAELGFDDAAPNAEVGWFYPPLSDVDVPGFQMVVKFSTNWADTYAMFGLEPPTE